MENYHTTDDKENVERKLNHVLDMGKMYIEAYAHISCTERVGILLAMTAAVNQVKANIQIVRRYLKGNLLDPYKIEYVDYARSIENLVKIWHEELAGSPIVYNLDTSAIPLTNPDEIVLKEDTYYDMMLDVKGVDFYEVRVGLMKNAMLMCSTIENGLDSIARTLRDIVQDYTMLKGDIELQEKKLNNLEAQYDEAMWDTDMDRLKQEAKEYVRTCNNDNLKETYQYFLNRLSRNATDPHDNKVLSELNECYLNGDSTANFVVKNRNQLSFEDIASHFCFVKSHRMVSTHIEMFDLWAPADDDYKDLFVNKAAQELAFLLAPTISMYVDFQYNYQYAALLMAMMDLGLVYRDRRNGIQMMKYVNECYLKDDAIKDQTTLTQWTGKLLGKAYGVIDEDNFNDTNLSLLDFKKLKDYYWLCLSIVNKVVMVNIQERGFAPYLLEEHTLTPAITDYRNSKGESVMERLFILKSAFNRESIFN